ncbi:hypothetical protein Syun_025976 [Stephania yunnanensis]|uniref:Uncharacterized protein n=1 Tax=Stephania yunnanensis TaxID=152371 RepID=A0AAP0ESP1_9MAGN
MRLWIWSGVTRTRWCRVLCRWSKVLCWRCRVLCRRHLRLRIREALRHPAESRHPHHQRARRHRPSPIRHRKDLYVALTICQMVDTSSRICCLAISSLFSFISIKAFDAFIGADFLGKFTRTYEQGSSGQAIIAWEHGLDKSYDMGLKGRQSLEARSGDTVELDSAAGSVMFLANHDVLATPDHMRSSIVSVSLFTKADVWLCTTVASIWTFWGAVDVMVSESVGAHASEYQSHSRHRYIQCEVARDRVRDPVECTDKNGDLVMHRDKDMDMFQLERDFNVTVWACGQPETISCYCHVRMLPWHILMGGDRWCVLCLEVSEESGSSRRSPACCEGAQPYRVRWGYGLGRVWPWAGMALGLYS